MEKKLLNRKEAADFLGISLPTLGKYTQQGVLKARILGNIIRYEYNEILESLKLLHNEKSLS